jgi:hypothetical protein
MAGHGLAVGRRGSLRLAAAVAALGLIAGGCSGDRPEDAAGAPGDATVPTTTHGPTTTQDPTQAPPPTATPPAPVASVDGEAADPVRLYVEAIGVDAPIIPLGRDGSGALEVPDATDETGWWTGGPEPGEQGPAVVAGHVDSRRGPAVFYRLAELRPGDVIDVVRADGTQLRFTVQRTERHAKAAFPTDPVYAPTAGAELRLISCGGAFDRSSGHYLDNVIVFAVRS